MNPDQPVSSFSQENLLSISWHDSSWIPILTAENVMEYFSQRSNPFYDRTCNNETLKMQRLGLDHLQNMIGLEYILQHVQDPILYVIRKQHRHSPTQVTPMVNYYILAGKVYQAPDLASVIGSRLLNSVHHMQSAFDEASSYSRYHPSRGYSWEFKENKKNNEKENKKQEKVEKKEKQISAFQFQRVGILLDVLHNRFPPKFPPPVELEKHTAEVNSVVKADVKLEIKTEKVDTPASCAASNTAVATSTATTTTTDTATSLLPSSPPPVTTTDTIATAQRNAMMPPPEKRPRLL